MRAVARARYKVEVGWDQAAGGNFRLGYSLLGGGDKLGGGSWSDPWVGPYVDVSGDVDEENGVQITRGRSDDSGPMQMGEATVSLTDATGKYNRQNAGSPLAGKLNPMVPMRVTAYGPGPDVLTAVSGAEITDAVRALSRLATPPGAGLTAGQSADDLLPGASAYGIWRAATNLYRYGQCDATTDTANAGTGVTRSTDATVPGPFSANSFKVVTDGGVTTQGLSLLTGTGLALAAGASVSGSVWFKGVAGQSYRANLRVDNTDASSTSGATLTFDATGGWQLLVPAPLAVAAAKTGDRIRIFVQISGTRAETFWVANAMIEAMPFVTPYVATSGGATQTRAAARVQAPVAGADPSLVAFAFRVRYGFAASQVTSGVDYVLDWRDAAASRLSVYYNAATGAWTAERAAGGSSAATAPAGAFLRGDLATVVAAFTPTQVGISVDGAPFSWAANTTVPTLADVTLNLGARASADQLNGDLLWAGWARGVPLDADAADLHAAGGELDFDALAGLGWPLLAWPASTTALTVNGAEYVRFFGFVRRIEYEPGGRSGRAVLNAVDFFVKLGGDNGYKPVLASIGATTTGAVIGRMLDAMLWTDPLMRSLDVGDSIPNWSGDGSQDFLQHVEDLLTAERGSFFVARDGAVSYRSRGGLIGALSLSTVADVMSAIAPGVDLDTVVNAQKVTATGAGAAGAPQTVTDDTSIALYDRRDGPEIVSPYLTPDSAAATIAAWIVALHADPQSSLWTLNLSNRQWSILETILRRDLLDRVTVSEAQTGTSGDFGIQQIAETIRRGGVEHSCSWLLREWNFRGFTLGSSLLGGPDYLV